MFTGVKEGNSTGGSYLKTGLTSLTFLGVNPTAAQIKSGLVEITYKNQVMI